ncbi:hypothetical protein BU26DRAFT_252744 [Trematosphaeria pertusa]|uniref:DUF7719 domain-containing protein n=1 Tax=Trematosphaeria pertusa TaxID=390896 RepID=A0A6A6IP74_9PLEO|nr:uncharacterized protein BU26DRAFT_252744 [Trematosphaeria pertusa]KAF2252196.1 hypothetical protein BU26DRAFT_252744 [Trematosphaeria pertusa]
MGGNRKERRAAGQRGPKSDATSTRAAFQPSTEIDADGVEYILKHPDRSGPKGKTLFELAEERQRELDKGKPARWNTGEGNTPAGERPSSDEDPIGPLGDAMLYSFSMAILHVTLDVAVYSQYREAVIWGEIFKRAGSALPIFFLLVYLTHVEFSNRFPVLRNLLFFAGAVAAGCYMIYSGNKHGYFYVMKAAPPVGALWIWSVVEMSFPYAAVSALAVLGYSKWNGFDFF